MLLPYHTSALWRLPVLRKAPEVSRCQVPRRTSATLAIEIKFWRKTLVRDVGERPFVQQFWVQLGEIEYFLEAPCTPQEDSDSCIRALEA